MLFGSIGSVVSVSVAGPHSLCLVALVSASLLIAEHSLVGFGRVSGEECPCCICILERRPDKTGIQFQQYHTIQYNTIQQVLFPNDHREGT